MENIYIAALEIGKSQIEDGITYLELKQALTDRGFKIGGQLENNFQFWFYSNFYCGHIFFIIQKDSIHKEKNLESEYQRAKNQKAYLTGDAHSKYIEYLELKEAREASAASMAKADESIVLATKSTTQAKNALMVSIIALSITFLVSVVTFVADRISASNNTSRQNLQWALEKERSDSLYNIVESQTTIIQNTLSELAKDTTIQRLVKIQSNHEEDGQ